MPYLPHTTTLPAGPHHTRADTCLPHRLHLDLHTHLPRSHPFACLATVYLGYGSTYYLVTTLRHCGPHFKFPYHHMHTPTSHYTTTCRRLPHTPPAAPRTPYRFGSFGWLDVGWLVCCGSVSFDGWWFVVACDVGHHLFYAHTAHTTHTLHYHHLHAHHYHHLYTFACRATAHTTVSLPPHTLLRVLLPHTTCTVGSLHAYAFTRSLLPPRVYLCLTYPRTTRIYHHACHPYHPFITPYLPPVTFG